jgi:putative cell wall-binding protein
VILAGGTEALSDDAAAAVAAALPEAQVRRVGPTRTHTAEELAKLIDEFDPSWPRAHIPNSPR